MIECVCVCKYAHMHGEIDGRMDACMRIEKKSCFSLRRPRPFRRSRT